MKHVGSDDGRWWFMMVDDVWLWLIMVDDEDDEDGVDVDDDYQR